MEGSAEIWEARKHIVWGNTTAAAFSFSAAILVLLGSYVAFGAEAGGSGLFAEAQTVVMILFTLVVFQTLYYQLISRKKIGTPVGGRGHSMLDTENTYFVAFAAVSASCVYVISEVGHLSNAVSALAASLILAVFFLIQLGYLVVGERREKRK